jgi:Family of unknown function (DUF6390)
MNPTDPGVRAPALPELGLPAPDGALEEVTTGAILFARYAYPPNELGYCGTSDHRGLLHYGTERAVDPGIVQLAQGFSGAWPYLEFIARATGIGAPLDRRVVEAYWLGGDVLGTIDMARFGNALLDRFRKRAGRDWGYLAEAIPAGAVPNHAFHVFGVYPWVGLLRTGRAATPLEQLEKCRIRWGQVVSTEGDQVSVLSRPLTYDGTAIGLGERRLETARGSIDGVGFLDGYRPGDWVSLHWGWVCDRLSRRQLHLLQRSTLRQFEITNLRVEHSGPRHAIG